MRQVTFPSETMMPTAYPQTITPRAWLILPGHHDAAAHLRVIHYPFWARASRTGALGMIWGTITVGAFFLTMFDPFLSSIPLIMGAAAVWRSWRGHFRVQEFAGECPRCRHSLALERGVRISSPHRMVCYHCHHEPHLALLA
jgi:hypothetical protein